MVSLVENLLPYAPGVCAPTAARRVSHPLERAAPASASERAAPASAGSRRRPRRPRSEHAAPASDFPVADRPPSADRLRVIPQPSESVEYLDLSDPVAWTPKNPRLAQLAEQIRRLRQRGHAPPARCPSGLPALDAALGGGFTTGAIHELVAPAAGAPAYSIALRVAARAAVRHRWILYIDTQQDLYPPALAQLGVPLTRLVVVRTPHWADAWWVCEQALRCPAVAAVVLPVRTVDAYVSRRLQLAAETGGGLGLLIRREEHGEPTFAATRLQLEPLVGAGGVRRARVTVRKMREGRPREPFVVELPDAADSVPAHSVFGDGASAARRCVGV